jgi:hypothetical protein
MIDIPSIAKTEGHQGKIQITNSAFYITHTPIVGILNTFEL